MKYSLNLCKHRIRGQTTAMKQNIVVRVILFPILGLYSLELKGDRKFNISQRVHSENNIAYIYNVEQLKFNDLDLIDNKTFKAAATLLSRASSHIIKKQLQELNRLKTDIQTSYHREIQHMRVALNAQNTQIRNLENTTRKQDAEIQLLKAAIQELNNQTIKTVVVSEVINGISNVKPIPRDCTEVYIDGGTSEGIYTIQPLNASKPFKVYCKDKWTYIHRKSSQTSSVNFQKGWNDYKNGFGSLEGDFWLGNEQIHVLTKQGKTALYIEIERQGYGNVHALYKAFKVDHETRQYKLIVSEYESKSTAANNLQYGTKSGDYYHANRPFSTTDRDNDGWKGGSCSSTNGGGWWYANCLVADLTGDLYWYPYGSIKGASMKIMNTVV